MKNLVYKFNSALNWINKNNISKNGIAVTSKQNVIYPEVTGYYIPSLLQWGERDLAISFAKYLCSIQKSDGSWFDMNDQAPNVFDSAQILKGLISIRKLVPDVDSHIIKGCDWILSNMQQDGRLTTPNKDAWGTDDNFCSELIHIYCLSPLRDAGKTFNNKSYLDAADKILSYYKANNIDKIRNFSLLSHFYAYVMEGLYDIGEINLCRESMERLEQYRTRKGAIPGLNNVPWICSTGLFQLAVVWYKLGELERGNSLFYYALGLQNETGGWYGSYSAPGIVARFYRGKNKPFYFPNEEISWAVKYFLDALALKEKLEFEKQSSTFIDQIDENDGRYVLIRKLVEGSQLQFGEGISVCDVGCGKGRYLKRLVHDFPLNNYFATDISHEVSKNITCIKEVKIAPMTNLPFEDHSFDIVYTCEAFEHAINLKQAFMELHRVTKKRGKFIIVDKPIEKMGALDLYEWEQWINDNDIRHWVELAHAKLEIIRNVPYENCNDGLFRAWIVSK